MPCFSAFILNYFINLISKFCNSKNHDPMGGSWFLELQNLDLNVLNLMVCLTLHITCNYIIIFVS